MGIMSWVNLWIFPKLLIPLIIIFFLTNWNFMGSEEMHFVGFKALLTDRYQYVEYNGVASSQKKYYVESHRDLY